jgi:hypothetical protein
MDNGKSSLVSRADAASYLSRTHLRVTPRHLAELASHGTGPVYRRGSNGRALYAISDLDHWAEEFLSPPIRVASEYPYRKQHLAALQ